MSTKSSVVKLKRKNFNSLVFKSQDMWLISFGSPSCPYCRRLKPKWKRLSSKLEGKVKFGDVNAKVQKTLSKKYKIKYYPTIKFFYKSNKNTKTYVGKRTSNKIKKYALKKHSQFKN